LGMNSTGTAINSTQIITPLPDVLKSRLAKGHFDGRESSSTFLPEVVQPSGALYSSANDLLKYLAANMGLIHTKINDIFQDTHLIRHEGNPVAKLNIVNSSSTTQSLLDNYIGLGWNIFTNLGSEVIYHAGSTTGYISFVAFNPTKQTGILFLCSCDYRDVSLSKWQYILLLPLLHFSSHHHDF
jgi:D-alanyl-D-alanine-carboxypeptidase/D-alanyl-D-alanine-endopeptidase